MREALRSAFGYAGYEPGAEFAGMPVSAETLAAATAAAGEAAVEEGSKHANSTIVTDEKGADLSTQYVVAVSPPSKDFGGDVDTQEEYRGVGWLGAEAAAAAAGAAAEAAMGAAGVAAGVAAEVAAIATAATMKVATPFGRKVDEDGSGKEERNRKSELVESWGEWKSTSEEEEEFGKGKLGGRPKKIDARKAMNITLTSQPSLEVRGVGLEAMFFYYK